MFLPRMGVAGGWRLRPFRQPSSAIRWRALHHAAQPFVERFRISGRAWIAERAQIVKRHAAADDEHACIAQRGECAAEREVDRKSTRLNSSHSQISYAVFCLKKKKQKSRNVHK